VLACCVLGPLLGTVEGWGPMLGIEYTLANAFGLSAPPSAKFPTSAGGKLFDMLLSMWVMVVSACAMGLTVNMVFMLRLMDQTSGTACAFFRYTMIYIPLLALLIAALSGGVLALFEGWPYADAFWFMAAQMAGCQLTKLTPQTVEGTVFQSIIGLAAVAFNVMFVALVGAHPLMTAFINKVEGREERDDDVPPPAKSPASLKDFITEKKDEMKRLNDEIDSIKADIARREKLMHTKMQEKLPVGNYTILVDGTSVTSGPGCSTDDVAELAEGTKVSVVETQEFPEEHRLRGRIVQPAGWISLRDTYDGYTWAVYEDPELQ